MSDASTIAEKAVLEELVGRGQVRAQEVARELDVPHSTVASILDRLVKRGVTERCADGGGRRGRPSTLFRLRLPQSVAVLQFDGTQLVGSIVRRDLSVGDIEVFNLMHIRRRQQAIELVRDLMRRLNPRGAAREDLAGVAMCINAVRISDQTLTSSVLPWASDEVEEIFWKALKLPVRVVRPVWGLAEYQKLGNPMPRALVRFQVADGVGAHAVIAGRVYRGGTSLAGELGHVSYPHGRGPRCGCGRRGCLEARCSGPAIIRRLLASLKRGITSSLDARLLGKSSPRVAIEHVWQQWSAGDSLALAVMDEVLEELSWGLALAVNLLDPDWLVAGGYVLHEKPQWVAEIERRARSHVLHPGKRTLTLHPSRAGVRDELAVIAAEYFYRMNGETRSGNESSDRSRNNSATPKQELSHVD